MTVRILGGGWYGCHIALALRRAGVDVELHETAAHLFAGASGGNPARLHLGFHYPRSMVTRSKCQETHRAFMAEYGDLTRMIPVNVYAIAANTSLVDFGTYRRVLRGEVDFVEVERPADLGLENVEGAVLTGERHILIDEARRFFAEKLLGIARYGVSPDAAGDHYEWTIDCTFCARDSERVERYEPCVTALLRGPTDRAVTIMDGPFPSLYPWNEDAGLSSLTSAKYTPLARVKSYPEARAILDTVTVAEVDARTAAMVDQIATYWPAVRDRYEVVDQRLTIRAQPESGADARFVDVVKIAPDVLRVRAGKIDAIFHAEKLVKEAMCSR